MQSLPCISYCEYPLYIALHFTCYKYVNIYFIQSAGRALKGNRVINGEGDQRARPINVNLNIFSFCQSEENSLVCVFIEFSFSVYISFSENTIGRQSRGFRKNLGTTEVEECVSESFLCRACI